MGCFPFLFPKPCTVSLGVNNANATEVELGNSTSIQNKIRENFKLNQPKIKPQQTTNSSDSSEAASFVQRREKVKQLHKAQSKGLLSFHRVVLRIFPPLFQIYMSVGNNKIPLHS